MTPLIEISVTARHHHGYEYMATVKLGQTVIWSGLVYGTDIGNDGNTHSEERAKQNAISIVGERLRRLLDDDPT